MVIQETKQQNLKITNKTTKTSKTVYIQKEYITK